MEDFLGNSYDVGDTIIYAAGRSRSITMVLAKVVSFNASGTITVQPVSSARWKHHAGRTRWIDSRTGKGIDPYATDGHTAKPSCYRHEQHGAEISHERLNEIRRETWQTPFGHPSRDARVRDQKLWRYQPAVWKDYVEQVTDPVRPVTLMITKNIVKVNVPGLED